jgi:hypothetical protein
MDMVTPPQVGDLTTEVISGMVEMNAELLDDDVTEARRYFMIKVPL